MVLFSVIIPTYKRPDLLLRCLDALLPGAQQEGAPEWEIIVTDDGDSEETRLIAASYYPKVIYTVGPMKGPAANRNHGATLARGQWLVFTDDDCVPSNMWLNEYAAAIRLGIVVYEGRTTCVGGLRTALDHAPINERGGCLWSCNFMIAATIFRSVGGFDEGFPAAAMEDIDLRERLKNEGCLASFVPSASVDHPARSLDSISYLLGTHQAYYYYSMVKQKRKPQLADYLLTVIRHRTRMFLRPDWSLHLRAASLYMTELILIGINHNRWCRQYDPGMKPSLPANPLM